MHGFDPRFFLARRAAALRAFPHRAFLYIVCMAAALTLGGCGGTGILRSYSDPAAEGERLERICVLAFHPNAEVKAEFERDLAGYLRERGNEAVEAHTLGDGSIEPTRAALRALVEAEQLDGVFTVRVLPGDPNQPGETEKKAYRPDRDGDLYQYFFETRREMLPDRAMASAGLIYLEGRVYRTSDAKVVWGGMTVSQVDESMARFTERYADAAVFELAAKGILK
jgi:hypothetical protein